MLLADREERRASDNCHEEKSPIPASGSHTASSLPQGANVDTSSVHSLLLVPAPNTIAMAASSVSSTLLCSSALSLRPRRSLNHLEKHVLFPAKSSVDCTQAWLSSSSEKPHGCIRSSSSRTCDVLAASTVSGSSGEPFSLLFVCIIWNTMEKI